MKKWEEKVGQGKLLAGETFLSLTVESGAVYVKTRGWWEARKTIIILFPLDIDSALFNMT